MSPLGVGLLVAALCAFALACACLVSLFFGVAKKHEWWAMLAPIVVVSAAVLAGFSMFCFLTTI